MIDHNEKVQIIDDIEDAEIIENNNSGKVNLGSTVVIRYEDDDEDEEYRIVGSKEADPSDNKISNESPIAKAIMGAKAGDRCEVESPNGKYNVKVIEVR